MKPAIKGPQRILLIVFIIALLGLLVLVISGVSYQGRSSGDKNNSSLAQVTSTDSLTDQPNTISSNCTAVVLTPEYSPKHFYPPSIIIYDSRPFLITWIVVNTSEDCVWSSIQLQTVVDGQAKILYLMPPTHSQPNIDEEFALWDKDNLPVVQVNPRQRVTITVQIDGLDLVRSYGKVDRTFNLMVNGQLANGGTLVAQQSQWAVVLLPSDTPTITPTPSKTSTGTTTNTPTKTASPTKTFIFPSLTWTPTIPAVRPVWPTDTPVPPSTSTPIPPTAPPPDTPTLPLPPVETETQPPP